MLKEEFIQVFIIFPIIYKSLDVSSIGHNYLVIINKTIEPGKKK